MRRFFASTLLLLAVPAAAQTAALRTSPGKAVQVGYYSFLKDDCSGGAKPVFRLGAPVAHGQLIVKDATLTTRRLARCGAVKAPAVVVVYKADPTFTGRVALSFDIVSAESRQRQHVDASVEIQPKELKV